MTDEVAIVEHIAGARNRASVRTPADADTLRLTLETSAQLKAYDGANTDLWRNNESITIYSSAARTAAPTQSNLTNRNGRGVHVVLDVTTTGSGTTSMSLTLSIYGLHPLSCNTYTLLAGAAVTSTGTTIYQVYPGAVSTANVSCNFALSRLFRVGVAHGTTVSVTYSVGAVLVV